MSQTFISFDETVSGSRAVDAEGLSREMAGDGFEMVTLYENRETGESTILMRIAPGGTSQPHAHAMIEEIYVLDGEFNDHERRYAKGHYCIRQAGAIHETESMTGALVLLVYRQV
jgi:quercetin dioxygenase-like cupin family protein